MNITFFKMNGQLIFLTACLFFISLLLPFSTLAKNPMDIKSDFKKESAASKKNIGSTSGQIKKSTRSRTLSPKIKQALEIVQKESSYKGMGQSLQRLKLSKKEKKILEREVKKQPYSGKLKRLSKSAQKKFQSEMNAKAKVRIAQFDRQAKQKHSQKVRLLNQQSMSRLSVIKSGGGRSTPLPLWQ